MTSLSARRRLVIATRESALAIWPAEHVGTRLGALYPHTQVELPGTTTQGDRALDHRHARRFGACQAFGAG